MSVMSYYKRNKAILTGRPSPSRSLRLLVALGLGLDVIKRGESFPTQTLVAPR